MGETNKEHRILTRKPSGKQQLARPRERWEDYININFRDLIMRMRFGSGSCAVVGFGIDGVLIIWPF
jgi:hypothetical protein